MGKSDYDPFEKKKIRLIITYPKLGHFKKEVLLCTHNYTKILRKCKIHSKIDKSNYDLFEK